MASQNPSGRLWLGAAIIFAVVIPLALWLGIAAQMRYAALDRATADQQYVVEAVGEQSLKLLDTQALLLDWIDQMASERDCQALLSDDRLQAFMSLAARKSPLAVSLWILNADGQECMGSDPTQMVHRDLSFREYFGGARTVGSGQYYVDRAIVGLSPAIPIFNVAKPRTKNGRFNGVILASVSLASLIDYWGKTLDIVHEQRVSLLRQDGATIARSWPPLVPSSDPIIERRIAAALTAPEGTNRGRSAVDGRPRLGAWRTLPGWNVVVSSSVNEDDVMAPWRQLTLISGGVAILTSALMGTLTWSLLTGRQRLLNTVKERTVELTSLVKELREAHVLAASREQQARESEEKLLELVEAREQQRRELERSNADLEEFAYIASHDLKEPLRGITNNARFLREDYAEKLGPEGVRRLSRLEFLSKRMEQLINDLLYFSRLGKGELAVQMTDLNVTIRDIEMMNETTLEERNATIVLPRELPSIRCDKTRISEVFRNLIDNAVKYNDNVTKIIEVGYLDEVKRRELVERGVFYVKDNGLGVSEEFHEEIFKIFKRLNAEDDDKRGTGVGLTFVRKIVERHSGRIWLDSAIGKGTTFYFTLEHGSSS